MYKSVYNYKNENEVRWEESAISKKIINGNKWKVQPHFTFASEKEIQNPNLQSST